jgi:hypothetical protein
VGFYPILISILLYYYRGQLIMECISEVEQMMIKVEQLEKETAVTALLLHIGWDKLLPLSYLLLQMRFLQYSSIQNKIPSLLP